MRDCINTLNCLRNVYASLLFKACLVYFFVCTSINSCEPCTKKSRPSLFVAGQINFLVFRYLRQGLQKYFLFHDINRRTGELIEKLGYCSKFPFCLFFGNFTITIILSVPVTGTSFPDSFPSSSLMF